MSALQKAPVKLRKSKGIKVSKDVRDKWALQAYQYLSEHPEEDYYSVASGDSRVMAFRQGNYIEIHDFKERRFWATWESMVSNDD